MKRKPYPIKSSTLCSKIRRMNPWNIGEKLSTVIESNWNLVRERGFLDGQKWFDDFCIKNHLAPGWVEYQIEKGCL